MKKLFLLITVLIATSSMIVAQQNYQDVVYLKNGSVIRGVITEQIPNQQLKIETADGNVFVFQFSEVEKLMREPVVVMKKTTASHTSSVSREKTKGYVGIIDAFYGIGVGDYAENLFGVTMVNGYRFNPYFSLGVGVGLKYYPDSETTMVPVFADLRATFTRKNITPFVALGIGAPVISDAVGSVGFFFNPHVGAHFRLPDSKIGLNVSVGYEMQEATIIENQGYSQVTTSHGAVSLKVGFSF